MKTKKKSGPAEVLGKLAKLTEPQDGKPGLPDPDQQQGQAKEETQGETTENVVATADLDIADDTLGQIAEMAPQDGVHTDEQTEEVQKLHGATFDGPTNEPQPGPDYLDQKIDALLDQIGEGLKADDENNREKLTIARNYGAMLWDLKAMVTHGTFKTKLIERFPKVSYAKCNRWMYISKYDSDVAAALEKYPDVAWGPKKMIDFLKGNWNPEEEAEDDEEEAYGYEGEESVEEEPLLPDNDDAGDVEEPETVGAMNPELAAAADEAQSQQAQSPHAAPPGATAGPVVEAVPTPKGRKPPKPGRSSPGSTSAVNRTEYEVEVRFGFKLSVPEDVTAEAITNAIRSIESWTIGINTPFGYEMSERGVAVNHVRPWDSAQQFEPEAI